jgi:hypothetical protein
MMMKPEKPRMAKCGPLPGASNVEVVLRYFHRCRHWSSTAMVLLLEGLRSRKVLVIGEYGGHEGYVVRAAGA